MSIDKEREAFEAWANKTQPAYWATTAWAREAWSIWMARAAAPAQTASNPMFWVRLCSDGMYEGPIHDKQIEDVRRNSGAWTPLYLGAAPAQPAQQERQPMTDDDAAYDYFGRSEYASHPENRTIPGGNFACFLAGVRFAERHHGIRKE